MPVRVPIWMLEAAELEQGAFFEFEVVPEATFDDSLEDQELGEDAVFSGRGCIRVHFRKVDVHVDAALGGVAVVFEFEAVMVLIRRIILQ